MDHEQKTLLFGQNIQHIIFVFFGADNFGKKYLTVVKRAQKTT